MFETGMRTNTILNTVQLILEHTAEQTKALEDIQISRSSIIAFRTKPARRSLNTPPLAERRFDLCQILFTQRLSQTRRMCFCCFIVTSNWMSGRLRSIKTFPTV